MVVVANYIYVALILWFHSKNIFFMHPNFSWIFFSIWLILGLGQGPFLQQKRPGFRPKFFLKSGPKDYWMLVWYFFLIRLNLPFLMYLLPTESIMSWIDLFLQGMHFSLLLFKLQNFTLHNIFKLNLNFKANIIQCW